MIPMKYIIKNSDFFSSIRIKDDLTSITLHYACELYSNETARKRIEALLNTETEIGHICCSNTFFKIYGLENFEGLNTMQRHPLELVLGKLHYNKLIANKLYTLISSDIKILIGGYREMVALQKMRFNEISLKFIENNIMHSAKNFKQIHHHCDIDEFQGRIVAFQTKSTLFNATTAILNPKDNLTQFALISQKDLDQTEENTGFLMSIFARKHNIPVRRNLKNKYLKNAELIMRSVTLPELQFLRAAHDLKQGWFEYSENQTGEVISKAIKSHLQEPQITKNQSKELLFEFKKSTASNNLSPSQTNSKLYVSSRSKLFPCCSIL